MKQRSVGELQILVDEHYMLGLDGRELKDHICDMHSTSRDVVLPAVSKKAKRERKRFLETGQMPQWMRERSKVFIP